MVVIRYYLEWSGVKPAVDAIEPLCEAALFRAWMLRNLVLAEDAAREASALKNIKQPSKYRTIGNWRTRLLFDLLARPERFELPTPWFVRPPAYALSEACVEGSTTLNRACAVLSGESHSGSLVAYRSIPHLKI